MELFLDSGWNTTTTFGFGRWEGFNSLTSRPHPADWSLKEKQPGQVCHISEANSSCTASFFADSPCSKEACVIRSSSAAFLEIP